MLKKKLTQVIAVATIAAGSVAIIVGCGGDGADDGPSPKDGPKQPVPEGGDKNGPGEGPPPDNPGGGGAAKPAPEGVAPGGGKK